VPELLRLAHQAGPWILTWLQFPRHGRLWLPTGPIAVYDTTAQRISQLIETDAQIVFPRTSWCARLISMIAPSVPSIIQTTVVAYAWLRQDLVALVGVAPQSRSLADAK